jgi:hypothetical protein
LAVLVVFEHQSTVDPRMAFRLLRYLVRIWEAHETRHGQSTRLPPVVPLVLYHGTRPWTAALDVFDLLALDPAERDAMQAFGPHLGYLLEDLRERGDASLPGSGLALLTLLLFKHIAAPDLGQRLLHWEAELRAVVGDGGEGLLGLAFVVNYVVQASDPAHHADLRTVLGRLGEPALEVYMTIAEQLRQEGLEKGLEKGRQEGRQEIARKLLARGLSVTDVAELTGLPVDEVRALSH